MNTQQAFNSVLGSFAKLKGIGEAKAALAKKEARAEAYNNARIGESNARAEASNARAEAYNARAEASRKSLQDMVQEREAKKSQKENLAAFEKALMIYNDKRIKERNAASKERQEQMKVNEQNYIKRKAEEYGINASDSKYALDRIKKNQQVKEAKE